MGGPTRVAAGSDDPDLSLVRRAGAGDQGACAALVDRHLPRVLALAGRLLGDRTAAEDVSQEAFLRVWRYARRWRAGEARFSTWLHRVTVNLCRDRLRRRREVPLEAAADPPSPDPGPEAAVQRHAVAARVEAALGALPERQRIAVVLCHYQELGNVEGAQVMGVTVEAFESLLARGRRRLREILAGEASDLVGEIR